MKPLEWNNEKIDGLEWRHSRLKDFLNLNTVDKSLLKDQVERSAGLIRVFVHPFYEEKSLDLYSGRQKEELREYLAENKKLQALYSTIGKLLTLEPSETPPVFILEEKAGIPALRDRLANMDELQNFVYIIPTLEDAADPEILKYQIATGLHIKEEKGAFDDYVQKNWELLVQKLKELGVQKILVGGSRLNVAKEYRYYQETGEREIAIRLDACVGTTINNLSKYFDVDVSSLTYPDSRKEKRDLEKEVAQENKKK